MNPYPYLHLFAWVAILGLTLFLAKSFWLPIALTAGVCLAVSFLLPKR
jgi:hypothetical protein